MGVAAPRAQEFQSKELPNTRIQPDRRWFGNTRVIGQKQLEQFRDEMSAKVRCMVGMLVAGQLLGASAMLRPCRRGCPYPGSDHVQGLHHILQTGGSMLSLSEREISGGLHPLHNTLALCCCR